MSLQGKVLFITGASRGIGLATAIRAAKDGACIAIAAKTTTAHPKLPGTIYTAKEAIEQAGGKALAIPTDIRDEASIKDAIALTAKTFGGIDILINNASAIHLAGLAAMEAKRYDLMHQINGRGSYLCAMHCLPHLEKAENPHILNDSPPFSFDLNARGMFSLHPKCLSGKTAYIAAKYLMTFWTLGLSEELKPKGIAVNSIWPTTPIDTAAVRNLLRGALPNARTPEIMADASYLILTKSAKSFTGNCVLDEDILRDAGIDNFEVYKANR